MWALPEGWALHSTATCGFAGCRVLRDASVMAVCFSAPRTQSKSVYKGDVSFLAGTALCTYINSTESCLPQGRNGAWNCDFGLNGRWLNCNKHDMVLLIWGANVFTFQSVSQCVQKLWVFLMGDYDLMSHFNCMNTFLILNSNVAMEYWCQKCCLVWQIRETDRAFPHISLNLSAAVQYNIIILTSLQKVRVRILKQLCHNAFNR